MYPGDPVQRRCYKIKNPVDIKIYNIQIKNKKYKKVYKKKPIGLSVSIKNK